MEVDQVRPVRDEIDRRALALPGHPSVVASTENTVV
jgi:hypothetical protein